MAYYYAILLKKDLKTDNVGANIPSVEFGQCNISAKNIFSTLPSYFLHHLGNVQILAKVYIDDAQIAPEMLKIIHTNFELYKLPISQSEKEFAKMERLEKNSKSIWLPCNIVAQVMPNGKERTKEGALREEAQIMRDGSERKIEDARREEMSKTIDLGTKENNVAIRAATRIAQAVINIKEKNVNKDQERKPTRRM